jgi:hypothetical protein
MLTPRFARRALRSGRRTGELTVRSRRPRLFVWILGSVAAFTVGYGLTLSGALASETASPSPFEPAPGAEIKAHVATVVDGGVWSVKTYRNVDGKLCAYFVLPGEGIGGSCYSNETLAQRPLIWTLGSRQDPGNRATWNNVWVSGLARREVDSIELVMRDCSVQQVPVDSEGIFLGVIANSRLLSGAWPHKLVARDAARTVITSARLSLAQPQEMSGPMATPPDLIPPPSEECR